MFRPNTTFVIGAGASAEFGLPVGSTLADQIAESASGLAKSLGEVTPASSPMVQSLYRNIIDEYGSGAVRRFADALMYISTGLYTSNSIDSFLHRNRDALEVVLSGKILIFKSIAEAEKRSSLAHWVNKTRSSVVSDIRGTWIWPFMKILLSGADGAADILPNISIVCFNYDRCIEYVIAKSIVDGFRSTYTFALNIVDRMSIYHPYGVLGNLTEVGQFPIDSEVEFGCDINSVDIWKFSKNIRTYTEQFQDELTLSKIKNSICSAESVIFLGFGFNKQNMTLLETPQDLKTGNMPVFYSSGYGIQRQVADPLGKRISHLVKVRSVENMKATDIRIEFGDTCRQLMDTYGIILSE